MKTSLTQRDKRTHYCATLRKENIGERVTVCGWVQRRRNLGSLIFIDVRDRTGILQLAFDENTDKEVFDIASSTRSEFVIVASGVIRSRGEGAINTTLPTGEIEVQTDYIKILSKSETTPFEILEDSNVKYELRLKYRYLDLRRPDLHRNIINRHLITKLTREYFYKEGFLEIETPNLVKPSPEGARDYLVPSRVHNGMFYALPQSPQLYKQLLMLSGFDKYMQIAHCFRDEDLRADRQPEFTQIDLEMSFIREDDIMGVVEGFLQYVFKNFKGMDISLPLQRMTYKDAMENYGSDKPDLRFGYKLQNLSDIVENSSFSVFSDAVKAGGSVRAIKVEGGAALSRKEIDKLTDFVKTYRAKGLAYIRMNNGEIASSFAKFLTEEENNAIYNRMDIQNGDIVFIVADKKNQVVFDALGALRCEMAKRMNVIKEGDYKLLWVTEFPLLEYDDEEGRFFAKHHPFTAPFDEDIEKLDTDPASVRARAYDIVINGTEAGGGSIRIHDSELQEKMFDVLGLTKEDVEAKFGYLIEGFKFGPPPHGGLAFGLDRLCALLMGIEDIREVIAFPKAQNASEIMSGAPGTPDGKALDELGISLKNQE